MIVYAIAKGARCGYLDPHYFNTAQKAYQAILDNFLSEDAAGLLNLSEPVVTNDEKGVGHFSSRGLRWN